MESEDKTNACTSQSMDEDTTQANRNRSSRGVVGSSTTASNANSTDIRRSTVKELIERYFYQLQRGCGNTKCTNVNCVSSGLLPPMTPNEAAAKALQLFSQDAALCDANSQMPKVIRPHANNTATSSTANMTTQQQQEQQPELSCESTQPHTATSSNNFLRSANLNSASSSSTSSSSSPRASNSSSVTSSGTSASRNSTGRATHGSAMEALFDGDAMSTSSSPERQRRLISSGDADPASSDSGRDTSSANDRRIIKFLCDSDSSPERLPRTSSTSGATSTKSSSSYTSLCARFPPVHYLNEQIVDDLIEKGSKDDKYEHLLSAIAEVYSSVHKLSQSFRRPLNRAPVRLSSSKLQELLGKSPCDLKKEDLRTLEGENEKDEDSTYATQSLMEIDELTEMPSVSSPPNERAPAPPRRRVDKDISMSDDSEDDDLYPIFASGSKVSKDFAHLKDTSDMLVDLESLRRVKKKLLALNKPIIAEMLNTNIVILCEGIKYQYKEWDWEQVLHCIIICFDMITNISNSLKDFEFFERSLPQICHVVRVMPVAAQARLTRVWSVHCKDQLHSLVQCCQQLISIHVIINDAIVQEDPEIIATTKVLKIAYYASILAGESDPPRNPILTDAKEDALSTSLVMPHDEEDELFLFHTEVPKSQYPRYADDDLAKELNLRALYCRTPVVPFDEFYNELLSDNIQMDRDYLSYKKLSIDPSGEDSHFSFLLYSFILTPATKVVGLYYDSRIRMYSERHMPVYSILNLYNSEGSELNLNPDLKLKVRRDNIVIDALVGLELVAMTNPKDLKKQLVIEFVGEQGIDEGGVSKEFFQLIVDEIFNVDFGMFLELDENEAFWFNSMSFENDAQFTLIGIIIGLAIYNNIILAVRFPMVVYRKLMGAYGAFYDLKDFSPTLYRSLYAMLEYENDDMEDVFMQTFKISYKNVFGDVVEHELKPGGADITVNQANKQDFVDLYADFLLNRSIERQFMAFKKGFEMVTDESPLRLLFRPEEIELLVCGSKKFDFVELEASTEYEGGYTKDTPIIKHFWEIVHSMPEESKRKLLEFTTGSDRVPVGGLSRLKLLITRHGRDCDRLPTSHTCFNILLLPEYSSKEKLEERLLQAITYSKGFGMI